MRKARSFVSIGSLFCGAAAGASAALLFAPQTGKRTRRQIRRITLPYIQAVGTAGEDIADRVVSAYESGREAAGEGTRILKRRLRLLAA